MKFSIASFLIFLNFYILNCQIVYTEPSFPTLNNEVTVYFDASQGTAGLKDCNCDVYVHTGVITSASTSGSDWKHVVTSWGVANPLWKMTRVTGEANLYYYKISPSIKQYYSINANEIVEKMAFVFRNATGSLEGKETGGKDIYIEVYPESENIQVNFLSPSAKKLLVNEGENIDLNLLVNQEVQLKIDIDQNNFFDQLTNSVDTFITATGAGNHNIYFTFSGDNETVYDTIRYTIVKENTIADLPENTPDGITILNDSSAIFTLFAPGKDFVFLTGDFNNWQYNTDYQLNNSSDGNRWWIQVDGLDPEIEYGFQYFVDGNLLIADPYSEYILDPYNDKYIDNNTFPDLKQYPEGETSGIISVFSIKQDKYNWKNDNFELAEKDKLIIYEMWLYDFIQAHNYQTLIDTLDYFQRLGVNAIELMPVNEFEGNISWGYNPSFHYALDKFYGNPDAFKEFVDLAHERGIAVILDIVYNHAFGQCPLVSLYWDQANNRPAGDSPWFNPIAKHPYNVGYDFNHESQATKYYVKRGLAHWLETYHVDGFRFDLSKGFTQKYSTDDSQMAAYDAGRIAILKDYADYIWNINPDAFVILEHFATNTEEKELANYGCMLWGNNNYQYNEATMGYASNLTNMLYSYKGWNEPNLVGYMESHDEERLMYKNLKYGNSYSTYSVKNLDVALDRMKLAGTFFFLLPGPKMMWQFCETGYDYSLFTCSNGTTVSDNCKLDPKPIRWDYYLDENRKKLFNTFSALIDLKKKYDVFNTSDMTYSLSNYVKTLHLNDDEINATILGNFNVREGSVIPGFQHVGMWYEFFTGDSLDVTDVNMSMTFTPGEYRLYTDKKLDNRLITNIHEIEKNNNFIVYPNPASQELYIFGRQYQIADFKMEMFDITGKKVFIQNTHNFENDIIKIDISNLNKGIYFLKIKTDSDIEIHKIVVSGN